MKTSLISLVVLLALAGCASTQNAGYAGAAVTRDASGKCSFAINDGKEYAARNYAFDGDNCTLVVQEGESKAFKGQAISAKAQAVFPVTDLANILTGNGK